MFKNTVYSKLMWISIFNIYLVIPFQYRAFKSNLDAYRGAGTEREKLFKSGDV